MLYLCIQGSSVTTPARTIATRLVVFIGLMRDHEPDLYTKHTEDMAHRGRL